MASSLCVSCAQLPIKERSLVVKKMRCPECKTEVGATSYGATFRIQLIQRSRFMLSPTFVTSAAIGAGLFSFVMLLVGMGLWTGEKVVPPNRPADPPAPNLLTCVPEVDVFDRFPQKIQPEAAKQRLNTLIANIKRENGNGANKDAFLLAQMDRRAELRGMPFIMGDACRLSMAKAQAFQTSVQLVRNAQDMDSRSFRGAQKHDEEHVEFWNNLSGKGQGIDSDSNIAALTQMLAPERMSLRAGLVQKLSQSLHPDATRALARAAVFDVDATVREAAIKALKGRPEKESAEVLMHGIRYPLPIVAKRSAQVMLALDRKDLLPQLAAFLNEPVPGDPEEKVVEEKKVCVVREVVRINHHRNCLLCHPPGADNPNNAPAQSQQVLALIPIPGTPFPSSPSEGYGNPQSFGEPTVRADTTYLRQDFSVMMPVENAAPWPEMQRFDFLVRSRVVEGNELAALQQKVQARPADFRSENHAAAVRVLEGLTGQQNVANAADWMRVIRDE